MKVLLNERETRIPIPSDTAPYYDWEQVNSCASNAGEAVSCLSMSPYPKDLQIFNCFAFRGAYGIFAQNNQSIK